MAVYILDEQEKEDIVQRINVGGISRAALAREYEVSTRTIGRIVKELSKKEATPESSVEYTYVASDSMIAISRMEDGETTTESITSDDSRYSDIFTMLMEYNQTKDDSILNDAFVRMSVSEAIRVYSYGRMIADVNSNTLSYVNELGETSYLSGRLATRILACLNEDNKEKLENLMEFSNRLIFNPSYDAVESLYDFIEHADIEITDSGHLICFKRVRDDFTDVRTRKFDNSPGNVVKEPRNEVNPDRKQTCAKGLHVCAKHYLDYYPGERIIRCSVDPMNVVAIPDDYNNSKMRVCEYLVLDEVKDR